jgi:hypothetical protein
MKFVRASGVKGGERQDDQIHYFFNRRAIEQSAHERVLDQEIQLAAGCIVKRRKGKGDKEVQEDTHGIDGRAAVNCLPPEQAGGNHLGYTPSEEYASLGEVESSGNQASHADC